MSTRVTLSLVSLALAATTAGCPDAGLRKIGASCTSDGQCASGLCASGVCLDPEADDDGDSLVNRVEVALGTDPLRADSDGDGVSDPAELGDLTAPRDSDGDGRLDAIESSSADVDGDCIVDQSDPRDSLSDPPSEELPEACGDGSISCDANPVAGTCAAPLGAMLVECFHPSGPCQVVVGTTPGSAANVTWDNGARMTWKYAGGVAVGQLFGPTDRLCGTVRASESADNSATLQVTAGPSYALRDGDDNATTVITCPSGAEVVVGESDKAALDACSGSDSTSTCTVAQPGPCVTDADCAGWRCCPIADAPEATGYCLPVETCPSFAR
ncbi:MAG: hypothetical protein CVU56_09685 [Deltaproteobacteria bacterium HGW-Deltaproteobacteria-14]|jgi:hypothetical protein|nr:MAG: hypothetical protein CVU56_09685 [Deltaproteobacteria bacterium HGW-Deltaproteobacteria-14]